MRCQLAMGHLCPRICSLNYYKNTARKRVSAKISVKSYEQRGWGAAISIKKPHDMVLTHRTRLSSDEEWWLFSAPRRNIFHFISHCGEAVTDRVNKLVCKFPSRIFTQKLEKRSEEKMAPAFRGNISLAMALWRFYSQILGVNSNKQKSSFYMQYCFANTPGLLVGEHAKWIFWLQLAREFPNPNIMGRRGNALREK